MLHQTKRLKIDGNGIAKKAECTWIDDGYDICMYMYIFNICLWSLWWWCLPKRNNMAKLLAGDGRIAVYTRRRSIREPCYILQSAFIRTDGWRAQCVLYLIPTTSSERNPKFVVDNFYHNIDFCYNRNCFGAYVQHRFSVHSNHNNGKPSISITVLRI